jgi:hypothetical protein
VVRFDEKFIGPVFLKSLWRQVTLFMALIEDIILRHVPARTVTQLDGSPRHFSHLVSVFLDREFTLLWTGMVRYVMVIGASNCDVFCSLQMVYLRPYHRAINRSVSNHLLTTVSKGPPHGLALNRLQRTPGAFIV